MTASESAFPDPATATAAETPWGETIVTVAVQNQVNDSRSFGPVVVDALQYWNNHTAAYAPYDVTFVPYTTTDDSPDIVVRFVPTVDDCGTTSNTATVGCASVLKPGTIAEQPEIVRIEGGYTNTSTREIIKHEFGHLLGLSHSDAPADVMAASQSYTSLPQPNATERTSPWATSTIEVYVSDANWTRMEAAEVPRQVTNTLPYFSAGADGTLPSDVTFEQTTNRTAAEIVVTFPDQLACTPPGEMDATCGSVLGYQRDGDAAFEEYDTFRVRIGEVETETVGWHLGYWVLHAFGVRDEAAKPAPWVDPTASDMRDWWE